MMVRTRTALQGSRPSASWKAKEPPRGERKGGLIDAAVYGSSSTLDNHISHRAILLGEPTDLAERDADRLASHVLGISPVDRAIAPKAAAYRSSAPDSVDLALLDPGMPLNSDLRLDMERRFHYNFSNVRVHTGSNASRSTIDIDAPAYSVGSDIVFGSDASVSSPIHRRWLVAHELAHVIQSAKTDDLTVRRAPSDPTVATESEGAAGTDTDTTASTEDVEREDAVVEGPEATEPACLSISESVGFRGKNRPEDVVRIQARLLELGMLSSEDAAHETPSVTEMQTSSPDAMGTETWIEVTSIPDEQLVATIQAIRALQTLLSPRKPDGLIQAESHRPTLRALQTLSEIDISQLRNRAEEQKRKAAEAEARRNAKAEADAVIARREAYENSPEGKAEALSDARALLREHATFIPGTDYYIDLDEERLGARLALMAEGSPNVVLATLDQLYVNFGDESQVVHWLLLSVPDETIEAVNPDLVERLYRAVGTSEQGLSDRARLLEARVPKQNRPLAANIDPSAWVTDQYWDIPGNDKTKRQCFDACKMMLDKFNDTSNEDLEIGGASQMLRVVVENSVEKTLSLAPTADSAVAYIDDQLAVGLPVIVGTHYKFQSTDKAYNEGTTDHFVLIVGKNTGTYTNQVGELIEAPYFQFYDPGRSTKENGTSQENRLYWHEDTRTWEGPTPGNGRNDVLSQVRPFTRDYTTEMMEVFSGNEEEIAKFLARRATAREKLAAEQTGEEE